MVNELKTIAENVKSEFFPLTLEKEKPSSSRIAEWRQLVASERKRILESLLSNVTQLSDKDGCRYLQNNEKNTIILAEQIHDFQIAHEHDMEPELTDFYEFVCHELDFILEDMERFYPCYFDYDIPIPYTLALKKRDALFDSYRGINELVCYADKDAVLWDIILKPIAHYLNDFQRPITFHTINYYHLLLRALSRLDASDTLPEAESRIHDVLIAYNFNDPDYIRHFTRLISSVAGIFTKVKDRLEKLYWFRKEVRQHPIKTEMLLLPDRPSPADLLTTWLDEEIRYWEARKDFSLPVAVPGEGYLESARKIRLVMSVAELGAVIRLLHKLGAIKDSNFMDVLRVVAESCTTTGAEEISVKSLHAKAYRTKNDPIAARSLRKMLLRWADFLNSEQPVSK
ncbi:hypothetical protein SAMN05660909_05149 [Chitinophaga terrae (ex Kim and Jung 2007)]|uniref:Uncharacterized protein n=1 Tax=Chitinophaga terrae (ex Kim and Jung 2007) TaxID=408074 RepID=A0A1H4GBW0_9BACT|nr:hypothetical protein [Chitinophaga terrae (ex Kim and Jung 2007)]GEP93285.1 hypothetical protein CTE07_49300 [Chitinophaga terrae (ex Kim and Jung 2007)]SEB07034.1 hypothetical protein SAMN05660909_05149 [Chitinophaga terrae (ex Kim and Jung 2007)]